MFFNFAKPVINNDVPVKGKDKIVMKLTRWRDGQNIFRLLTTNQYQYICETIQHCFHTNIMACKCRSTSQQKTGHFTDD